MRIGTTHHGQRPLRRPLTALCLTQITSWAVLYYAFPVALADIAAATGWPKTACTAAFSTGQLRPRSSGSRSAGYSTGTARGR